MMVEYLGCYGGGVSGLLWWSTWVVMCNNLIRCGEGIVLPLVSLYQFAHNVPLSLQCCVCHYWNIIHY